MLAVIEGADEEKFELGHFITGDTLAGRLSESSAFGNVVAVELEMACWFGIDRGDVSQQLLEAGGFDVLEIHVDGVERRARSPGLDKEVDQFGKLAGRVPAPRRNTSIQYPVRISSP